MAFRAPPRLSLPEKSPRKPLPPRLPPQIRKRTEWKHLRPKELLRLKNLLFSAKTIVEGLYSGRHKSPYKGSSPEFVDYREYYPGDEIRSIDWKAYARTDRHFIKLFERETDMNGYILLDKSASMDFGGRLQAHLLPDADISKLDYASSLAAALAYLMVKQGDKVSLALFDEKLRRHVPPGGTFAHLYSLLTLLEQQKASGKTSLPQALREIQSLCRRRGLLIVISDFLDDPAEILGSLNLYRHRGFEVILFQLLHKHEYRLPLLDSVRFVDSETGEALTSKPAEIRKAYEAQLEAHVQTIASAARSRGIDHHLITTETPYATALQKYLLKRNSR